MIDPALFSWRFLRVWKRNLVVYKKIWKVNFLTPLFEPLFYILAFGLGFSGLIDNVKYGGVDLSYTEFIAPALIATAVMWNAFFETTYASFVRMYYQKTFDGMLATPLSLEEIIIAEIAWSATKSVGAATIMVIVLGLMGFVQFPIGLLLIPLATAAILLPDPRWQILFGWLSIWGWAATIMHGMLSRIVPFLVWFHRYSTRVGLELVPSMRSLLPQKKIKTGLYLHLGSVLLGVLVIVFQLNWLAQLTGLALVATAISMASMLIHVLRHR